VIFLNDGRSERLRAGSWAGFATIVVDAANGTCRTRPGRGPQHYIRGQV